MKFLKSLIAVIAIVVTNAAQLKNRDPVAAVVNIVPKPIVPIEDSCKKTKLEVCATTNGCHVSEDKKFCKKSICRMATNQVDCTKKSTATYQCKWEANKCSKKKILFTEAEVPADAKVIEARKLKCAPSFNDDKACNKLLTECQWRKPTTDAEKADPKEEKKDKCRYKLEA